MQAARPSAGPAADMARAMGAELNISEGSGTVDDYARFFREASISESQATEEEASRRGLLSRNKGSQGYSIGKYASDDLYTAYFGGKVSADKAAAIADVKRGII